MRIKKQTLREVKYHCIVLKCNLKVENLISLHVRKYNILDECISRKIDIMILFLKLFSFDSFPWIFQEIKKNNEYTFKNVLFKQYIIRFNMSIMSNLLYLSCILKNTFTFFSNTFSHYTTTVYDMKFHKTAIISTVQIKPCTSEVSFMFIENIYNNNLRLRLKLSFPMHLICLYNYMRNNLKFYFITSK